jgi:hypothetical protein
MQNMGESPALDLERPFRLGTEKRFPLDLNEAPTPTWGAYELSLRESWDPEDEELWGDFDEAAHSDDDRAAAALVWSHRAWVDFTAIAESEAVLVRVCLEPGIGPDLKYCLSMRAVERARSTDLAQLAATRLDRYRQSPSTVELAALLNGELVRRALHETTDVTSYMAAHLVAQAAVDLGMWQQSVFSADSPLAELTELVIRDKSRMLGVAWDHLAAVVPDAMAADRSTIAESVASVLAEEANGRQVPVLLAEGADRDQLLDAHARAAAAGLGGVAPDDQLSMFAAVVDDVSARMAGLGVIVGPVDGLPS